tara:strand:- start:2108 stop:2209 length:102 start_codon:yes stop_codon:yes gene_type:complete
MNMEIIFAVAVPLVVIAYVMVEAIRYEHKKNNQ